MQLLEMDKTRRPPIHPQSNAVIEKMTKTLQNMLQNIQMRNKATDHNICLML